MSSVYIISVIQHIKIFRTYETEAFYMKSILMCKRINQLQENNWARIYRSLRKVPGGDVP
jgi:hypothetical protein